MWTTQREGRGTRITTEHGSEWVPDSAVRWRPDRPTRYEMARSFLLGVVLFLIAFGLLTGLEAKAEPLNAAAQENGWTITITIGPFGWPLIWVKNVDAGSEG